jgi:hypothetical protein
MYLFDERKRRILAWVRDLKCGDSLVIICLLLVGMLIDVQLVNRACGPRTSRVYLNAALGCLDPVSVTR